MFLKECKILTKLLRDLSQKIMDWYIRRAAHLQFINLPDELRDGWSNRKEAFGETQKNQLFAVVSPESRVIIETVLTCHRHIETSLFCRYFTFALLPIRKLPDSTWTQSCRPHAWFPVVDRNRPTDMYYWDQVKKFPQLENSETLSKLTTNGGLSCFPDTVSTYLKGKVIIDGGAWIGDTALIYQRTTASKVYAFEPFPSNYNALCEISRPFPKIVPIQKGLSSEEGALAFGGEELGSDVRVMSEDAGDVVRIPVTTIDAFMDGTGEKCGLIKLDVEGMETDVLKGALTTLKRDKPLLLISIYHNPQDFFGIAPWIAGLNLGYKFVVASLHQHYLISEIMLVGWSE
jgi:FkbM family methyltransferase